MILVYYKKSPNSIILFGGSLSTGSCFYFYKIIQQVLSFRQITNKMPIGKEFIQGLWKKTSTEITSLATI